MKRLAPEDLARGSLPDQHADTDGETAGVGCLLWLLLVLVLIMGVALMSCAMAPHVVDLWGARP